MSKFGKSGSFVIATSVEDPYTGSGKTNLSIKQNYYIIMDPSQLTGSGYHSTDSTNSAVKPTDLLALDIKIDDGLPYNGNVKAEVFFNNEPVTTTGANICNSSTAYLTTNNYTCTPYIRIGASAGDPQ